MKRLLFGLALVLALFAGGRPVEATTLDYTVSPVLPKNQRQAGLGYFDLVMKSSAKQTLKVNITNRAAKAKRFTVSVNRATTNANGVLDYATHGVTPTPSSAANIESMMTGDQTVTVPGNSTKAVAIKLAMPKQKLVGSLLGGIRVAEAKDDASSSSGGVAITNRFAYVIAVQLQAAKAAKVAPSLKLAGVSVSKDGLVTAKLSNAQPALLKQLKVHATITPVGKKKATVTLTQANLTVAPNSTLAMVLNDTKKLVAGDYRLAITATTADKTWHLKQGLKVTGKATNVKTKAVPTKTNSTRWGWWVLGIGIVIVVIAAGGWWWLGRGKHRG